MKQLKGSFEYWFKKIDHSTKQPACSFHAETLLEAWQKLAEDKKIPVEQAQEKCSFLSKHTPSSQMPPHK